MEFNFNDVKRFVPLNEGDRILYLFDKKSINVKLWNISTDTNKVMKGVSIDKINHGHFLIQFETSTYKFKYELYRGKVVPTKQQKVSIVNVEPNKEIVKEKEIKVESNYINNNFFYNLNLSDIQFTDHFYDRVKQRLERSHNIISDIAYESDMLFKVEAQTWIMKSLITLRPEDLVVANKIVYVGNIRKKVWTVSVIIGIYTVIIESYPEKTKVVSFMNRSKTELNIIK